ncbi:MAG TPA: carbamate kinase [Kiritimatiellia bacterium]|nr:carbamate kinase [Kiritimatiellia bacterium]
MSGAKQQPLVVLAIGGNSLIKNPRKMTVLDQYRSAGETCHHISHLVRRGYRVVITHGNGPQVGFILLRSELAKGVLHQVPLESCVADTQGAIGYQIAQTLRNELRRQHVSRKVAAVVTQVVVNRNDPAFRNPTKPIGPFYSREDAERHMATEGWSMKEDAGRGWRRVVASPQPKAIIEEPVIKSLVDAGVVVVALGGGGIPVTRTRDGILEGCPAVIDKDLASCLLARHLRADIFMISTGVRNVVLHYGTPKAKALSRVSAGEMRRYLEEGHFGEGSMKPKVEAALDFLEHGGKHVIITRPQDMEKALKEKAGTHIFP